MGRIQKYTVQKKLRELFGGDEPVPAMTYSPEVVPVAVVSDASGAVPDAPQYTEPRIAHKSQAAVAGQYSYVQFYNPPASGEVVELTDVFVWPGTAGYFTVRRYTGYLGASTSFAQSRDLTNAGARAQLVATASDASAGTGTFLGNFYSSTSGILLPLNITMPPGHAVLIVHGAVNVTLSASFYFIAGQISS